MNAVNFRTINNRTDVSGVVIPFRVEANLGQEPQDVFAISETSKEFRKGREWAAEVNRLLSSMEPTIAEAVKQDQTPSDLMPSAPGTVAISGQEYDVFACFTPSFAGGIFVTAASVCYKGKKKKVLEFSVKPDGATSMSSESGHSFVTSDGQIDSSIVKKQIQKMDRQKLAIDRQVEAARAKLRNDIGWNPQIRRNDDDPNLSDNYRMAWG